MLLAVSLPRASSRSHPSLASQGQQGTAPLQDREAVQRQCQPSSLGELPALPGGLEGAAGQAVLKGWSGRAASSGGQHVARSGRRGLFAEQGDLCADHSRAHPLHQHLQCAVCHRGAPAAAGGHQCLQERV